MKSFAKIREACWSTHKQVGFKKKGNRLVPDCVPKNTVKEALSREKPDEQTETMDLDSMHRHLGAAKMKLIVNHPDFKDHFGVPMITRIPIGARFRRTSGIERVDVAHAPMGENKFRKMVTFTFGHSGKKISTSEIFHNRNDERHTSVEGKPLLWRHLKTNMHKTDAAFERRLAKKTQQENFQDGRGPGRPGDSQREGIPKNASLEILKKIRANADPKSRKWVLAHWQINMRKGQKQT